MFVLLPDIGFNMRTNNSLEIKRPSTLLIKITTCSCACSRNSQRATLYLLWGELSSHASTSKYYNNFPSKVTSMGSKQTKKHKPRKSFIADGYSICQVRG